jgi:hypothetical protein
VVWIGPRVRPKLEEYATKRKIRIVRLSSMIKSLYEKLDPNPSYDDEALQLLRLLKLHSEKGVIRVGFPAPT